MAITALFFTKKISTKRGYFYPFSDTRRIAGKVLLFLADRAHFRLQKSPVFQLAKIPCSRHKHYNILPYRLQAAVQINPQKNIVINCTWSRVVQTGISFRLQNTV
jgi:hypothetical protein